VSEHAPVTVLIVDDEEPIRHLLERILQKAGYVTATAATGAAALAAVASLGSIDVLVTDMMMPEMTGDELARRLRRDHPALKVLYFTGYTDRLFDEKARLWEDEAFLEKPCTPPGLLEAIALLQSRNRCIGPVNRDVVGGAGAGGTGVKRILLVDDDSSVLKLLATALSDYDLTFARDGSEAWVTAMRDGKPDLLITDYMMPSLFGDELIARLRALWPDLKVLVLTGHGNILDGEAQSWWQSESHLAKPFEIRALREQASALMGDTPAAAPPANDRPTPATTI
jgi:CheY-like chemotaxis protein